MLSSATVHKMEILVQVAMIHNKMYQTFVKTSVQNMVKSPLQMQKKQSVNRTHVGFWLLYSFTVIGLQRERDKKLQNKRGEWEPARDPQQGLELWSPEVLKHNLSVHCPLEMLKKICMFYNPIILFPQWNVLNRNMPHLIYFFATGRWRESSLKKLYNSVQVSQWCRNNCLMLTSYESLNVTQAILYN